MRKAWSIVGLIAASLVTAGTLAIAIDLGDLGKSGGSSGPGVPDITKICEKGSNSERTACFKDAAGKSKTAADLCDKQASTSFDSNTKKKYELCRDQGRLATKVLQCIADGGEKGGNVDDLKKSCPATLGVKLGM